MKKFNLVLILFIILFIYLVRDFLANDNLKVNFLDIGQGDAIHVRYKDIDIIIDGGPDNILLHELSKSMPWWDRDIEYLVVSHYHADHMMGFIELMNKYKVKNILLTSHEPDDYLYKIFIKKAEEQNTSISLVEAGEKFIINDNFYWQVLLADDYHEDYNENSMVMKITYFDNSFLFTGDLGFEGEKKLLSSDFDLQSQYLKVGHHGSKYSSSPDFLEAVKPEFCIIQSGKDNKFGHPHEETIARLNKIDCQILNTQYIGNTVFKFN